MKTALAILAPVGILALYLLLWPTGMEPVAWTPPPAPKLEGVYAHNEKLKGIQRLAEGVGVGPEAINVDAVGRLYTGYADGRVVQLSANGGSYVELAATEGRPLGLTFGPNGGVVVADAEKGLLHIGKKLFPLVNEAEGTAFGFANDTDNTRFDKNVYFTDSSNKFGEGDAIKDLLEHGANGRLLEYNVVTKKTRVLLSGLHFPNGVAVGPDDAYVLVSEMGEYRILRYWLKGQKAGSHDVFIDNLPGFPDNLSYNDRGRFWVALFAPRDAMLDRLLPGNFFLRQVAARLPAFVRPAPKKHAFVLGLGLDGKVVSNLQYAGRDAYAPITSVREHGPWLYFGSLKQAAIGRLPIAQVESGAPAPPPGWEQVPQSAAEPPPTGRKAASQRKREAEAERDQDRK